MSQDDPHALVARMGQAARGAATVLASAPSTQKDAALQATSRMIGAHADAILAANARDLAAGCEAGLSGAMMDRLRLDPARLEAIAGAVGSIAAQPDPVGRVLAEWDRPNGLHIRKVATPLGVLGVIYESRPNVTADAGALALKSGNAVILRGGSDSLHSSTAIHAAMAEGLQAADLPGAAIQLVTTPDRGVVDAMLRAQGLIDVIIPRGGKGLVERVQTQARVPVFAHLEGVCHVYADGAADLAKARRVVLNAKTRRTGICGAAECLLIDRAFFARHGDVLIRDLMDAGIEVRAEGDLAAIAGTIPAKPDDFGQEFLAPVIATRLVDGVGGAIDHIRQHGSGHTESVLTEDDAVAARFFAGLDSAILMHNASTQFADGGEFGMGAEIGISTGKMHARGPVGAEQLTSFKYLVTGDGAIRAP